MSDTLDDLMEKNLIEDSGSGISRVAVGSFDRRHVGATRRTE
jgi:hypothetical protein